MAASAANVALGIEILAVQKLYYPTSPGPAVSILLLLSTQCLGYGFAGLFRRAFIHPARMLYPANLPVNSLIEALHSQKPKALKRLRFFWITFALCFVWEMLTNYIMPVLGGTMNTGCPACIREQMLLTPPR